MKNGNKGSEKEQGGVPTRTVQVEGVRTQLKPKTTE
jgi:hypothetical protein